MAAVVLTEAQFSGRQPVTLALDVGLSLIRVTLPILGILLLQELLLLNLHTIYNKID